MNTFNQSLSFAARRLAPAMVGLLFLVAGYNKIGGFDHVAGWMAASGLPAASLLLVLTIALEIGAGLMLIVGFRTRWAALALAAFLVPTTVIFHGFWSAEATQVQEQLTAFLKNLAILGATLMIAAQPQAATANAPTGVRPAAGIA
ncbi:DoxX family protein [Luteimonas aestuarii]|uniref:DoxX family protein n=1 Tax=Luteimonas aestuarii TaxID=453837 RepID=A0A4R5TR21_9GAMM|nr:DoxX family protein [Luteimonas aestuarii]TDK23222.1 DoxX family protein [Luteimonas aestuarii]